MRRCAGQSGQSSVELVVLLPVVLAVAIAALAAWTFASARRDAASAAHAGVVALLQDQDPLRAARAALPPSLRDEARINRRRSSVEVRLRVRAGAPPVSFVLPVVARATVPRRLSTVRTPDGFTTTRFVDGAGSGPQPVARPPIAAARPIALPPIAATRSAGEPSPRRTTP